MTAIFFSLKDRSSKSINFGRREVLTSTRLLKSSGIKFAKVEIISILAEKLYFRKTDFSLECLCCYDTTIYIIVSFDCSALIFTIASSEQISCQIRGQFKKGKDKRWSAYTSSEEIYTGVTVSTIGELRHKQKLIRKMCWTSAYSSLVNFTVTYLFGKVGAPKLRHKVFRHWKSIH